MYWPCLPKPERRRQVFSTFAKASADKVPPALKLAPSLELQRHANSGPRVCQAELAEAPFERQAHVDTENTTPTPS